MPALVAGLLLGVGDRTSWLAAILSDRGGRPVAVRCVGKPHPYGTV